MPAGELLRQVRVASPCRAAWDRMEGDERVRFCGECHLHVYNLSEMTAAEAEVLIREKEGRLCVRYYQRRDGTVLSRNCPVGLRRLRRALLVQMGAIATLFMAMPVLGAVVGGAWVRWRLWKVEPFPSLARFLGLEAPPPPAPPTPPPVVMGAMAVPPPLVPGRAKQ